MKQHKIATMLKTFEYLILTLLAKCLIHVAIMYKAPPPSSRNRFTSSDFRGEFQRLLSELVLLPGHLIIAGDFNHHMDGTRGSDARRLANILEVMNLVQHVTAPTHKHGHTLDLIITAAGDSVLTDFHVEPPSLCDQSLLICTHASRISKHSRTVVRYRRLKGIDRKALAADAVEGLS